MKKTFRTAVLLLASILILLTSCNDRLQKMDDGSVNEYIYPYLRFTPTEDGTSLNVSVLGGAKLNTVKIPSDVNGVKVGAFVGFENPEDAKSVKDIILGSGNVKVSENALKHAENLNSVKIDSKSYFEKWGELPILEKDGHEFLGWYAGDDRIYAGMPMDPENSIATPRWKAHQYIHHEGKEATCTEGGSLEYWECISCHKKFKTDEGRNSDILDNVEIAPLGHDFTYHEMVKATCTLDGSKAYYSCSRCGRNYSDEEGRYLLDSIVIPAAGHELLYKPEVPATCQKEGSRAYYYCSSCNEIFEDKDGKIPLVGSIVIPKLDHSFDGKWSFDGDCHWHECSLCHERTDVGIHVHSKKVITKEPGPGQIGEYVMECECGHRGIPVPMTEGDHSFDEGSNRIEPTCTADGSITYTCTKCGYSYVVKLDKLNHRNAAKVEGQAATCQKEGVVEHWHCPDCNKAFTDQSCTEVLDKTSIDRLPHRFETKWSSDSSNHWHECELCHQERKDIAPHVYSKKVITKEPGPDQLGEYVMECECGRRTDPKPMTKEDHNLYICNEVKPTCTEDGYITYCCRDEGCKFTYTVSVPKINHGNAVKVEGQAATCQKEGVVEHWHCPDCNLDFRNQECTVVLHKTSIDRLSHRFETKWSSDNDEHWHECGLCHLERKDVAPHDYSKKVITKKPGPDEIGEYVMECECGRRTDPRPMTKDDHNLQILSKKDATCTEDGYVTYHCIDEACGYTFTTVIEKRNHEGFSRVSSKAATCTENGNIAHVHCNLCGRNFKDETFAEELTDVTIPKLGHDYSGRFYDDGKGGHYQKCSRCDSVGPHEAHVYDREEKLPGNLNIFHEATCTEAAEYYRTCKCGAFNPKDQSSANIFTSSEDGPLGHDLVYVPASDRPCAVDGHVEYWECSRCHTKYSDAEGTKILEDQRAEHSPSESYETDGSFHYLKCSVCGEVLSQGRHDSSGWGADKDCHWPICSVCGYVMGPRQDHEWVIRENDYYCSVCHTKSEDRVEGGGGFDITVTTREPRGHLEQLELGNGQIQFSFVDDNPDYPATSFTWSVNNQVQAVDGNVFTLNVEYAFDYQVKCMVRNENGVFSESVMIDGSSIIS